MMEKENSLFNTGGLLLAVDEEANAKFADISYALSTAGFQILGTCYYQGKLAILYEAIDPDYNYDIWCSEMKELGGLQKLEEQGLTYLGIGERVYYIKKEA